MSNLDPTHRTLSHFGWPVCMIFGLLMVLAILPSRTQGEDFLPPQDIRLSGRVTAPSCTASVNTTVLTFESQNRQAPQPVAARNGTLGPDGQGQLLVLQLTSCNPTGVGVKFIADTIAGYPERGLLRLRGENNSKPSGYYTVGLAAETKWQAPPLMLATNSAVPIKGKENRFYFQLDGQTYWFDTTSAGLDDTKLQIPLRIDAHILAVGNPAPEEIWEGIFTLNLSYR